MRTLYWLVGRHPKLDLTDKRLFYVAVTETDF